MPGLDFTTASLCDILLRSNVILFSFIMYSRYEGLYVLDAMLFGSHAVIFGLTLVYSQHHLTHGKLPENLRGICLECTTAHGWVGSVGGKLPFPNPRAKNWILGGRFVNHI